MRLRPIGLTIIVFTAASCGKPLWHPRPANYYIGPRAAEAIRQIELVSVECSPNRCPTYSFTLNRDGTARYHGEANVSRLGHYAAPLDTMAFRRIADLIVKHGFFAMDRNYSYPVWDLPATVIRVQSDGALKSVAHTANGPADLKLLERLVDSVAQSLMWKPVR